MKLNCEVRQASSNLDAKHYDTARIRKEYLVEKVMTPDEINMVYSMFDRISAGGAVPVKEELVLTPPEILRAEYFTQRREIGIINVGGTGIVKVGEEEYTIPFKEAIYIGRGEYGTAAAFAAILTVITAISLFLYMAISKSEDDIQL